MRKSPDDPAHPGGNALQRSGLVMQEEAEPQGQPAKVRGWGSDVVCQGMGDQSVHPMQHFRTPFFIMFICYGRKGALMN